MTSSTEHKKSSEIRRREEARWWMRDLLEAAELFVFAPAMRPCAEPDGCFPKLAREEPREKARKSGNFQRERAVFTWNPHDFALSVPESANDAPIVLPTFHRMRVHPKKPISCSHNLGSPMGVWEMGHQDGEKSSSRMLWVHKKIHNFPILAASTSFSFSSCSPLVALYWPGRFDVSWFKPALVTLRLAQLTLLNAVRGADGCWSPSCTSILSVSNWWMVRFCTCWGRVDPLIVLRLVPLMLLMVVLVSAVVIWFVWISHSRLRRASAVTQKHFF